MPPMMHQMNQLGAARKPPSGFCATSGWRQGCVWWWPRSGPTTGSVPRRSEPPHATITRPSNDRIDRANRDLRDGFLSHACRLLSSYDVILSRREGCGANAPNGPPSRCARLMKAIRVVEYSKLAPRAMWDIDLHVDDNQQR